MVQLIIVLEGPDGGGKSTLAQALIEAHPGPGHITHFGPPDPYDRDALAEYFFPLDQEMLAQQVAGHPYLVVLDRLHVGDTVYARYRPDKSPRISPLMMTHCEMWLSALGALKVACLPPLAITRERVITDGDDYISVGDLPRIHREYTHHFEQFSWHTADWAAPLDVEAKNLLGMAALRTAKSRSLSQCTAGTYTGALSPRVILAGDEIGAVKDHAGFTITRPFTPVTGYGCSEWLLQAVTEAGIVNSVGMVNSYHPGVDLAELARLRPDAKWVALGNRASTALLSAHIDHAKAWHPQFARRFKSTQLSKYAAQLRAGLGTEEGTRDVQPPHSAGGDQPEIHR